ncbi:amino acid adenylation domain-containing protein [Paraburkholderia humisilvae]|uniref:amino acid adenylation domain-containing protein n=1 Tax=Paraburkholderia humisilvae TaxID=627669 RepID=UPI00158439FC|nr:amino acid adenylation domain-containing protein [Paraburkholderia humisilvae]
MDSIFRQQADRRPAAIAAVYGAQEISYLELDRRADRLAAYLSQHGIQLEEPIGILLEPGLDQVVCQLGILRAGGSCMPLDPGAPGERLEFMVDDLDVRMALTTAALAPRVAVPECVLIEDQDAWPPFGTWDGIARGNPVGTGHRTHILFTSGTTGRPKAVEILARGVIRLAVDPHYISLGADDRIAAIANPTFDASLFEIWGALLNGGTVVMLPKQTFIDPHAFRHSLHVQRITSMFITATLFNQTVHACPDAFRGLRQLLVGGEALNPRTLRAVLDTAPPRRLVNGYGPTECTTFSLCHDITRDDVEGDAVPIGKPIDNTYVFVLDNALRPTPQGEIGEIHIGGDGLARGYWNRPELTAERFIEVRGLVDGQALRLYKTGDLGSWQAGGTLHFHGRNDNQVKIRGHRIEIEEIELVLLASGLVRDAVVTVQQTELGDRYLMAFVVPQHARTAQDPSAAQTPPMQTHASHANNQLVRYIESRLPVYMRPRITLVKMLPMNANGKVDRRALVERHRKQAGANEPAWRGPPESQGDRLQPGDTLAVLRAIWCRTLDVEAANANDNFFSFGGDSLQAASLVLQISRQFNYPLPVRVLYDYPTPSSLAQYLDSRTERIGSFTTVDETTTWLADTVLPDDIRPLPGPLVPWRSAGRGRVFMTGVTGFLGAFVLRDLCKLPGVSHIACLVRATSDGDALVRIRDNMTLYGVWEEAFADRLQPVAGDLAQADLGLGSVRFDDLANQIDVVFHLAAHVNYIQPYSAHKAANITGTTNILRFTTSGQSKPLHYVSTIAVFGPAGLLEPTPIVYEDEDLGDYLTGLKFDLGYSQSKWVTEQRVKEAQRRGIPVAVYRPGFIMGDSKTGAGNPDDFVARLIKGCIAIGSYPTLQRQGKEFIPVDFVSESLLRIASDDANLGYVYHLVPQHAERVVDLMGFFEILKQCGHSLEALPYQQWVRRLIDDRDLAKNALMPLVPMLAEPVYGQLTRWEVYEGMPVYDTRNTGRALAASGGTMVAPLDRALLQRYLDYWIRIGFLDPIAPGAGGTRSEVRQPEREQY